MEKSQKLIDLSLENPQNALSLSLYKQQNELACRLLSQYIMYLQRQADDYLKKWVNEVNRKPLLIRGARQVGKTSVVRQLAKQFPHYIELNFEEEKELRQLFQVTSSVKELCEQLSIIKNTPIIPGKTLLFLDEIQACKEAIEKLRFFYEKMPELHVIAAGSLLEFVLETLPSFGVGRIRSMFMYPLSFPEFLLALNEDKLLEHLNQYNFNKPLPDVLHQKLLLFFKKFVIIGGMPEAVRAYTQGKSFIDIQRILDDLIISVQADFVKYKERFPAVRLIEVLNAVTAQVGNKFTYASASSALNDRQIKEGLHLLTLAGLIFSVTHSSANGIPLGAEVNPKKRKFLIYDTGIYQRLLGLEIGDIFLNDDFTFINNGRIAELSVGLEMIKSEDVYNFKSLYYWQREARNSQAELDYIAQFGAQIIPIEVKAGMKGGMKSLFLFLKEKNRSLGIRVSSENFGSMDQIRILPIYSVHLLRSLVSDY